MFPLLSPSLLFILPSLSLLPNIAHQTNQPTHSVALLLQLIGATKLTSVDLHTPNAQSQIDSGRDIALAGIGVQLVCFGLFTIISGRFNFTSTQFEGGVVETEADGMEKYMVVDGIEGMRLKALLRVVNGTCALILVRSVYRMME
jgi:hypothetical protein